MEKRLNLSPHYQLVRLLVSYTIVPAIHLALASHSSNLTARKISLISPHLRTPILVLVPIGVLRHVNELGVLDAHSRWWEFMLGQATVMAREEHPIAGEVLPDRYEHHHSLRDRLASMCVGL